VSEGLAACVNRVAGVRSTYRWQGRLCDDAEVLLVIKTPAERIATLCARLEALHPYDVPEVIALPIVAGAERYLAWLGQTRPDADRGGPQHP
jgi:periplasmic divalent cation tolerance protein